VLFKEHQANHA